MFAVSVDIGGNADVAGYCRKQRSRSEVDMRQRQAKCFKFLKRAEYLLHTVANKLFSDVRGQRLGSDDIVIRARVIMLLLRDATTI